jgi:hypothetical protein
VNADITLSQNLSEKKFNENIAVRLIVFKKSPLYFTAEIILREKEG